MQVRKIFRVDDEGITTEDLTDAELLDRVKGGEGGRWHRDQEWPILFVPPEEAGGATLIVPFEDPAEFRLMVQNEDLEGTLAVGDLDMGLLERIEEELA